MFRLSHNNLSSSIYHAMCCAVSWLDGDFWVAPTDNALIFIHKNRFESVAPWKTSEEFSVMNVRYLKKKPPRLPIIPFEPTSLVIASPKLIQQSMNWFVCNLLHFVGNKNRNFHQIMAASSFLTDAVIFKKKLAFFTFSALTPTNQIRSAIN